MVYYCTIAAERKLPFVAHTVAYDLASICERAFSCGLGCADELLDALLDLCLSDSVSQTSAKPATIRVLIKLACALRDLGFEDVSYRVTDALRDAVHDPNELADATDVICDNGEREFFEISDRGVNFDYLPPEHELHLEPVVRAAGGHISRGGGGDRGGGRRHRDDENASLSIRRAPEKVPPPSSVPLPDVAPVHATATGHASSHGGSHDTSEHVSERFTPRQAAIAGAAVPLGVFVAIIIIFILDAMTDGPSPKAFIRSLLQMDQTADDPLSIFSLPLTTSTILVLVASVSTLVVQIAATRFTPLIAVEFFRDRVITTMLGFLMITEIYVLIASHSVTTLHRPNAAVFIAFLLATISIACLPPYFAYVKKENKREKKFIYIYIAFSPPSLLLYVNVSLLYNCQVLAELS